MSAFYGSDTACVSDLGLVDTQISDPVQVIGQRIARRLQTPRGALALIGDDPDFGFDVRQLVNGKYAPADIHAAQTTIQNEVQKDEQVDSAIVSISIGAGGLLAIGLQVVSAVGPFGLTLNVTDLTVDVVFAFEVAA